jgi:hypothetical protein
MNARELLPLIPIENHHSKAAQRYRLMEEFSGDGTPSLRNAAIHILSHTDATKVHDACAVANDHQRLENIIVNATSRVKEEYKTDKPWMPERECAGPNMVIGLATGMAIGLAVHPDLMPVHYTPQPNLFYEFAYRTLIDGGALGVFGAFTGLTLGKAWGVYQSKKQAKELMLPPAEHDRIVESRRKRNKMLKYTGIAALAVASLHNMITTYQNMPASKIVPKPAIEAPVTNLPAEMPEAITIRLSDLTDSRGYKPKPGEYVYGLACGEGLDIAENGKLKPTASIDYVPRKSLKEQFLIDNASTTSDINKIPANGSITIRDVNHDGKVQFAHPQGWDCSSYR